MRIWSTWFSVYGATFWLPSIIRKMGHFNEFQLGRFNSIPWPIPIAAMYVFAMLAARFKFQQTWVACVLPIAALDGMYVAGQGNPIRPVRSRSRQRSQRRPPLS
ncbi:major facilitator superfamily MFS_1 domain protein [Paraburkholderia xenovorans LB400]|nr:major facilitator superfamily MFS_1 domain protein [Paraburkholderia xenovorans LB400]